MTNRITARITASATRIAALLGLSTAAMIGILATPAYADNDHDNGHGNGNWNRHWNQPRPVEHRYNGYYRQPDVYYSAPPVVYQPYYQAPAPLLNLNFR
jgi:hypothetical protein